LIISPAVEVQALWQRRYQPGLCRGKLKAGFFTAHGRAAAMARQADFAEFTDAKQAGKTFLNHERKSSGTVTTVCKY